MFASRRSAHKHRYAEVAADEYSDGNNRTLSNRYAHARSNCDFRARNRQGCRAPACSNEYTGSHIDADTRTRADCDTYFRTYSYSKSRRYRYTNARTNRDSRAYRDNRSSCYRYSSLTTNSYP